MTCLETRKVLPRIAERDGAPRVALETARHLAGCMECAGELLRLRELSGLLDRIPIREVPVSFSRQVLRSLRSKRGMGFILLVTALAGTLASNPSASGGIARPLIALISGSLQVAGTVVSAFLHAADALAGIVHTAFDGSDAGALLWSNGGSPGSGSSLGMLALFAGVALAGSWTAFAFGVIRFSRERRSANR